MEKPTTAELLQAFADNVQADINKRLGELMLLDESTPLD